MPTISEDKLVWDFTNAIWICGGVISGLVAILRTSSWSRRQGISNTDFGILPVFVAYTARYMGLVFFLVIFLGIFFLGIYYTGDGMPWTYNGPLTRFVRVYIAVAFGLRTFDILLRIVRQSMAECFFIDWEKPKSTTSTSKNAIQRETPARQQTPPATGENSDEAPAPVAKLTPEQNLAQRAAQFYAQQQSDTTATGQVSVWRTYNIAHRWLELLAKRTVSPTLLYLTAYLILAHSALLDNVALVRPAASAIAAARDNFTLLSEENEIYRNAVQLPLVSHPLNRLATITCTIFGIAIVYYGFVSLILERYYVNPVYQLIDLCSICNISVLIFSHRLFGYYIHGRSPFGSTAADTGQRALSEMLAREGDASLSSVVSHRGLALELFGDVQTFCVVITEQFRTTFTRLVSMLPQPLPMSVPALPAAMNSMAMMPMTIPKTTAEVATVGTPTAAVKLADKTEEKLREAHQRADAYASVNNFLMSFIQHGISTLPYVLKKRVWLESMLDAEFRPDANQSPQQQFSVMFSDPTAQFESLFLRGIEFQLWIFECLLFVLIDLHTGSIALATAVTLLSTWFTTTLRRVLGRIMLFRHALLDERFLS